MKLIRKPVWRYGSALIILLLVGGSFFYWKTAFGVTRTWDGGGTDGTCGGAGTANNWTCAANWSADTVPTGSDIASFDGTSTKDATINASISVAGINIAAGYSGTITQSSTYTVTVGSSHYVQAAGTFAGGSGLIDINGTFALSGGTFTSTSGTLKVGYEATVTIFSVSGGTFNHNNGTVKFYSGVSGPYYTQTVDVSTTLALYNVECDTDSDDNLVVATGDTIIAANNFTHTNGQLIAGGAWEVQGNYTVATTADGGTAGITFTGGNNQTYTDNGGNEPDGDVTVNKSGGTVTLASNADWNATNQDVTITSGTLAQSSYNITTTNFTVNGGTFTGGSGSLTTAGPLLVSSGTFTGGAGNVTINNIYTLSGGIFTAPSGILQIGRDIGADDIVFTVSGGTFNHNNGTVKFTSNGYYAHTYTVDVPTSLTLYNIDSSVTCGYVNEFSTLSPASGDTIIAAGNFIQTDGALEGTWQVQGNVTIGSGADGGGGTLTMTGTGSKTYTYTASGTGAHLRVNNAGISVSANGGTTGLKVTLFSLLAGTFTAPTGTLEIGRNAGISETVFTVSGGTFNHNNGTVKFTSNGYYAHTYTVDVPTSLTLYNIDSSVTCGYVNEFSTLSPASGDTIIAAGNFIQTDGALLGTWEVKGNTTIATTADGGTATLSFTGPNDQTYTDQGGDEPNGNITINKPVGTVLNLASNADWNAASQTTTLTSGILNFGSYTLSTGGTLTVGANGVLHDYSTGDLVLGGNVSNSGVIRLESAGSCGSTDSITITSSTGGVQRTWSGSGVYTLWDVSVRDQGGTAKIPVWSGTSVSGNGTNFVFSSACNLASNNTSLTSGLVGYWPMEENSGTSTADMSGNGNNGTLTNGPTWITGKIGQGVSFDAANDLVVLQDSPVFDFGGAGSFCHWLYSLGPQTGAGMFSQDVSVSPSGTSYKWLTYLTGNSSVLAVYIRIGGVAYSAFGPSKTVSYYDNAWHHICGTFDKNLSSDRLKIYIDGVLAGTNAAAAGDVDAGSYPSLGAWYGNNAYYFGRLDEVRLYNRALTATEVQQLYNNVRPAAAGIPSGKFQVGSGKLKFP